MSNWRNCVTVTQLLPIPATSVQILLTSLRYKTCAAHGLPAFCRQGDNRAEDDDDRHWKHVPREYYRQGARQTDIFSLKHESSIFRSFIQPCKWFLHDATG